jgi:beta-lactamase class A
MKKVFYFLVLLFIVMIPLKGFSQSDSTLRKQIDKIAKSVNGIVGVSVLGIEDKDTLSYNGTSRLVLHSVIKLPIAMAVLNLVDSGKLKLDALVHIKKRDLVKDTYSPLRDKYPNGEVNIPLSELLSYMVSLSDNNACDILLNIIGGPQVVEAYLLGKGIKGVAIQASEADMADSWEAQYTNWAKPIALTRLLDSFYQGKMLLKPSTDFLFKLLTETSTGPKRIKGLLPEGTVVAHKTGTSPTNKAGLSPATNDVGIITLPNGKHLAIAILVGNAYSNEAAREAVIANIAKAVWDFHNH